MFVFVFVFVFDDPPPKQQTCEDIFHWGPEFVLTYNDDDDDNDDDNDDNNDDNDDDVDDDDQERKVCTGRGVKMGYRVSPNRNR